MTPVSATIFNETVNQITALGTTRHVLQNLLDALQAPDVAPSPSGSDVSLVRGAVKDVQAALDNLGAFKASYIDANASA